MAQIGRQSEVLCNGVVVQFVLVCKWHDTAVPPSFGDFIAKVTTVTVFAVIAVIAIPQGAIHCVIHVFWRLAAKPTIKNLSIRPRTMLVYNVKLVFSFRNVPLVAEDT